jgi:hypothetical protein
MAFTSYDFTSGDTLDAVQLTTVYSDFEAMALQEANAPAFTVPGTNWKKTITDTSSMPISAGATWLPSAGVYNACLDGLSWQDWVFVVNTYYIQGAQAAGATLFTTNGSSYLIKNTSGSSLQNVFWQTFDGNTNWTNLSFSSGDNLLAAQMTALQDNFTALGDAASGAPKFLWSSIQKTIGTSFWDTIAAGATTVPSARVMVTAQISAHLFSQMLVDGTWEPNNTTTLGFGYTMVVYDGTNMRLKNNSAAVHTYAVFIH